MIKDGSKTTHPFTAAGMGEAPFTFVETRKNVFQSHPSAPAKGGGTCAHCSMGIMYEFVVRSADGIESTVGCECVKKTGDENLVVIAESEKRKINRQKREEREQRKLAELRAQYEEIKEELKKLPSGNKARAEEYGETMLDYVEFILDGAGTTGQMKWYQIAINTANNV